MVLHLLDQNEIDLTYDQQTTFQDLESGEKLQVDPRDIRDVYRRQVQDYLARVRRVCGDSDVEYHDLFIHEPYDKAMVRLLSRRA